MIEVFLEKVFVPRAATREPRASAIAVFFFFALRSCHCVVARQTANDDALRTAGARRPDADVGLIRETFSEPPSVSARCWRATDARSVSGA
jgi:hypothetical protein